VKYHIRDEPICKFEVIDRGLRKFTGNPKNINTRKNQILSEKFKMRKEGDRND
jgi:hypothetical protein